MEKNVYLTFLFEEELVIEATVNVGYLAYEDGGDDPWKIV
jgi:hypothetical protein